MDISLVVGFVFSVWMVWIQYRIRRLERVMYGVVIMLKPLWNPDDKNIEN
jgi:hypothetical protein